MWGQRKVCDKGTSPTPAALSAYLHRRWPQGLEGVYEMACIALGPGVPEPAPCPLIAAGFCARAGGSRGSRPSRRFRSLRRCQVDCLQP